MVGTIKKTLVSVIAAAFLFGGIVGCGVTMKQHNKVTVHKVEKLQREVEIQGIFNPYDCLKEEWKMKASIRLNQYIYKLIYQHTDPKAKIQHVMMIVDARSATIIQTVYILNDTIYFMRLEGKTLKVYTKKTLPKAKWGLMKKDLERYFGLKFS